MSNKAKKEVLEASNKWVESFNRGDINICAETYLQSTVMQARPMGEFEGRDAICHFWGDFVSKTGASNLEYSQIEIEVVDENTVKLSAQWSMNVGRGFITKELWVKQGRAWFLAEDDFTVVEQF